MYERGLDKSIGMLIKILNRNVFYSLFVHVGPIYELSFYRKTSSSLSRCKFVRSTLPGLPSRINNFQRIKLTNQTSMTDVLLGSVVSDIYG